MEHMKILWKIEHFWHENIKISPSFTQRYNGRHYVVLLKRITHPAKRANATFKT